MCLTIPGQIVRIEGEDPLTRRAVIDYSGERRTVQLLYLPEARVGDWVVVHAGFATTRVSEQEALEARRYQREMAEVATAMGPSRSSEGSARA